METRGPDVNERTRRESSEASESNDGLEPRDRRLGDAERRIAALARRVPDDVAAAEEGEPGAVGGELVALIEELSATHAQLRRQSEELQHARQLLDSERDRFRELFELAPEGHLITDEHGAIREANRGAAAILNISLEHMLGKPLVVFVEPSERRAFRVRTYRARAEGAEEAWTMQLHPRDAEALRAFVAVSPLLDSRGAVTGLRWLIRDISNRRAGAVWDRTPAALLRGALDALSTHVAVVAADGTIVTVNSAWRNAARPAGLFERAGAGANYLALCQAAAREGRTAAEIVRSTVERVLENHGQHANAVYSDHVDGPGNPAADGALWFALRVTRCEGPEPATIVVTHEDVTAEHRAHARETALLRERTARAAAEAANRAKSEFLTTLSHELRTPLNAIAGYAQLLEMGVRGPVTHEQAEDLRRILRSEQHLLGLINDLLDFSRVERAEVIVQVAPVRLHDVALEVAELVEPQAIAKSLDVGVVSDDRDVEAMADPDRLRQILLNLLTNAVKFTPADGAIRIECTTRQDRAVVCVHDTGIGIPSGKQELVFDPFVQVHRGPGTSPEGIGLGLAISRSLARAMGGDVTVRSEPGHGSTFELSLSRAHGDAGVR